jgi:hypothetical protein
MGYHALLDTLITKHQVVSITAAVTDSIAFIQGTHLSSLPVFSINDVKVEKSNREDRPDKGKQPYYNNERDWI